MIKCCFLVYRRHDLTREQFEDYWGRVHSRLAVETAPAMGMVRYVQNRTRTHPLADGFQAMRGCGAADFDGMAEAWWESWEALEAAAGAMPQEVAAAILADEAQFIDMKRSLIFFAEERTFWPQANAAATLDEAVS